VPREMRLERNSCGQVASRVVDAAIAELAERQHGVVGRDQLVELGLSRHEIDYRLRVARLHALHRGVYAVGQKRLPGEAVWMAAVLAAGPGAALSHRPAAALWGIRADARGRVEVTTPHRVVARAGIQARLALLPADERTNVDGIPVTTVPRTLLDLAAVLRRDQLERALEQAEALRLADSLSLAALLERHPGRRGAANLKAVLAEGRVGAGVTRSRLEERFLAFVASAGLPRPDVNVRLCVAGHWIEADCLWREHGLIVELDSRRWHATRAAFDRDRARDRRTHVAGWRVVRVTWRDLQREGAALESDLRALIAPTSARRATP